MKTTYEKTSWGWLAYSIVNGRLCRGRGETKSLARHAMLEVINSHFKEV